IVRILFKLPESSQCVCLSRPVFLFLRIDAGNLPARILISSLSISQRTCRRTSSFSCATAVARVIFSVSEPSVLIGVAKVSKLFNFAMLLKNFFFFSVSATLPPAVHFSGSGGKGKQLFPTFQKKFNFFFLPLSASALATYSC
ncbi:hypothetical protein, partial [Botryobacter ruber]|uniref:hypothetical protein n=1 Tax=Botryobacter ruber TaxID=2171629 RepID=UPI00196AF1C0